MKKKILLIDDDEDLLRSFQVILEGNGFSVITAPDGSNCFTILEKDKPDLLVLDVMMRTDFEGYDLLKEIKKCPEYKGKPVILLSGMRDHLGIDFFATLQDNDLFPHVQFQDKPVNSEILVGMIREMLKE